MQQTTVSAKSQLVVCTSRSPAEAGNQVVGRAEIRRAAFRTQSSNTDSRRRAPDPVAEPKRQFSVVVPVELNLRCSTAPPQRKACLRSAGLPGFSASKTHTFVGHWPAGTSAKIEHRSQGCRARRSRHQRVRPNPSFKWSANGRPPAPGRWYRVHFHRPGAGVLPLSPT